MSPFLFVSISQRTQTPSIFSSFNVCSQSLQRKPIAVRVTLTRFLSLPPLKDTASTHIALR